MTIEEARQIMHGPVMWEPFQQMTFDHEGYIYLITKQAYDELHEDGRPYRVTLDGHFTADELEALAVIMRQEEGT